MLLWDDIEEEETTATAAVAVAAVPNTIAVIIQNMIVEDFFPCTTSNLDKISFITYFLLEGYEVDGQ